ncbi:hypothetical protein GGI43DRAFT_111837 [Trichoderma evansii]
MLAVLVTYQIMLIAVSDADIFIYSILCRIIFSSSYESCKDYMPEKSGSAHSHISCSRQFLNTEADATTLNHLIRGFTFSSSTAIFRVRLPSPSLIEVLYAMVGQLNHNYRFIICIAICK